MFISYLDTVKSLFFEGEHAFLGELGLSIYKPQDCYQPLPHASR